MKGLIKMQKRVIAAMIACAMILSSAGSALRADAVVSDAQQTAARYDKKNNASGNSAQSGFEYTAVSGDSAEITGWSGSDNVLVIPDAIDGLTVKSIAVEAFKNNKSIISVTVPESIYRQYHHA